MITSISKFSQVIGHDKPNACLFLDIDDTSGTFDKTLLHTDWWKETLKKHFDIHGDYEKANQYTLTQWRHIISTMKMEHTDKDGLQKLIFETKKAGNIVVAVTARDHTIMDITKKHIEQLEIEFDKISIDDKMIIHNDGIFFVGSGSKGEVIATICEKMKIKHAVFIDDLMLNLIDVQNWLTKKNIHYNLYLACFN
jgi:uncharacterized HAD superfamily protein